MKLSEKLDEFVERQGIVSAEFCKIIDEVGIMEEHLDQLRNKIKLLDALKENAELKFKDVLTINRKLAAENAAMKEALEFYADRRRWVSKQYNGDMTIIGDGDMNIPSNTGLHHGGKRAREVLNKLGEE